MEINAMSSMQSMQSLSGVQGSSSMQSSLIMISSDEDEDKKTIIIASSQQMQGIASQYYRDSLGRPAIGTYDSAGAMQGTLQSIGTNINIQA